MNLLETPWLRVRRHDGDVLTACISDISNTIIEGIVSPRADFRGAIYQLLIGLLQTAFAPEDRKQWQRYWKEPPAPEMLAAAFEPYRAAFVLDAPVGEPAFMQDLTLDDGEQKDISALLIEAPGGKTIRDNQDHFVKQGQVRTISPDAAAMSLFTLQINAPSGGVGHRVSLRGGGPLTTLVMPPDDGYYNSLWHKLWLNVLTREEWEKLPGDHSNNDIAAIFPWMGVTRTSEKKGMETYPDQVNPLQAFWSMPRRMRLQFQPEERRCDLTGETGNPVVKHYITRNYGINYAGAWIHPLTPYAVEDGKEPISIKAQPGGLGYRHWLGLVAPSGKGRITRSPARVVRAWEDRRYLIDDADFHPRLWAFGYDMDNMKARCWYEAEMPIFSLDREQREELAELAQKMVEAATETVKILKTALKQAWFKRPGDVKGDISFIDANFWSATEANFYKYLQELVDVLDDEGAQDEILARWHATLKNNALALFDQYALSSFNEDGDLARVVQALDGKKGLNHYLNGNKALKALAV